MKVCRVIVKFEYIADIDNEEMLDHVKDAIVDDINAGRHNDIDDMIEIVCDEGLTEKDIPEFLLEEE